MADIPSDNINNMHIQPARYQYCLEPRFSDGVARFQVVGPPYTPLDPQKKEIRLIKIDHNPEPGVLFSFDLVETSPQQRWPSRRTCAAKLRQSITSSSIFVSLLVNDCLHDLGKFTDLRTLARLSAVANEALDWH